MMTVATARKVSVYLALAALLAAVMLVLAARRSAPASESAEIQRRYGALLLRVDEVPSSPGRSVVNVSDFKSLARLAERYQLLVLHSFRDHRATFAVQDECTTYLYRCAVRDSTTPMGSDAMAGDIPAEVAVSA
jgi:hypothetical protein